MPDPTNALSADSFERTATLVKSAAASRNRSTASRVVRFAGPDPIIPFFLAVMFSVPHAVSTSFKIVAVKCSAAHIS